MAENHVRELARHLLNLGAGYKAPDLLLALAIAASYCISRAPQERRQAIFDVFCGNVAEIVWPEDSEDGEEVCPGL